MKICHQDISGRAQSGHTVWYIIQLNRGTMHRNGKELNIFALNLNKAFIQYSNILSVRIYFSKLLKLFEETSLATVGNWVY